MTDNLPVAANGPLPQVLQNSSLEDLELDFVLDAKGARAVPRRFECTNHLPESTVYKYLEKRIEDSEADRQELKTKSGRFEK